MHSHACVPVCVMHALTAVCHPGLCALACVSMVPWPSWRAVTRCWSRRSLALTLYPMTPTSAVQTSVAQILGLAFIQPALCSKRCCEPDCSSFAILTGANMSGKSTYLRQVALQVVLAQVCFHTHASCLARMLFGQLHLTVQPLAPADWLLCAGRVRGLPPGRPPVHSHRDVGQHRDQFQHVHGGNDGVCSRPSRVMQKWQMHTVLMWKETCAGDCIHCEACYRAEPGDHRRARARHVHSRCGHVFKLQPPLFPGVKETPNTAFM